MLTVDKQVSCGNPLQQAGSGSEPDPEPNRGFGQVAHTSRYDFVFLLAEIHCDERQLRSHVSLI